METLMKRSFFVLIAILGMTTLRAQSVDDIVGKYVDAIGGKAVLASVKSLVVESTVDVQAMKRPAPRPSWSARAIRASLISMATDRECVTPTGRLGHQPDSGTNDPTAMPADVPRPAIAVTGQPPGELCCQRL
jgi:hypothetical protein